MRARKSSGCHSRASGASFRSSSAARTSCARWSVKNGRRYRYYVSAALITEAGTDRAQGWRLAAREIEEAVIRILADALTNPARLVGPFGAAGMPSDQVRKLLGRAARLGAALSPSTF